MPYANPEKQKEYHRQYMKTYLADRSNRRKHLARVRKNTALYRDEIRSVLAEFKSRGCVMCPEKELCCMSAHHLRSEDKEFALAKATGLGLSVEKVKLELKKCVCLCENCHRKVHAGLLKIS